MNTASCRLETDETIVEKRVTSDKHLPEWNLSDAIIAAIKAFDAANPTTTGVSTLAKRVKEGLQ